MEEKIACVPANEAQPPGSRKPTEYYEVIDKKPSMNSLPSGRLAEKSLAVMRCRITHDSGSNLKLLFDAVTVKA